MSLKIAVQMDPVQRINIKGDSTFALLWKRKTAVISSRTTRPTGWHCSTAVFAHVESLSVRDKPGDHFTLDKARRAALAEFDVVLLRQDPPFDLAYVTTTTCSNASTRRHWSSMTLHTSATHPRRFS